MLPFGTIFGARFSSCNIDRQSSSAGYFNQQGDCQVESNAGFQVIPDNEIDPTFRDVLSPAVA